MRGSKQVLVSSKKLSDAALDGLFGGLAGGVAMVLYLILWGWITGQTAGTLLGLFDGGMRSAPLTGALTHLAVSAVYGLAFGLIWRTVRLHVPAWLAGVVYGLALVMIAEGSLLPMFGSRLAEIPTVHFAVAHVIYGAILGVVCEWIAKRAA